MTEFAVRGPLDERDLDDELGTHPVGAPGQSGAFRERRLRDLDAIEPCAELAQEPRVESGADLAGKHDIVAGEVANQQRAETDAAALRVGEPADDQLLRRLAFHLQPVRRAAVLVRRVAALCNHPFPSLLARALPRSGALER